MTRIVIDPVTRVGGHLRIEADVEGGVVTDAWSAATMFRGLELALPGRDPRDAWLLAERICGSDNGVHALASVRAVERALGVPIPPNARLVRNLLAGSQLVTSHVSSFYLRHAPDWADLSPEITGTPAEAAGRTWSVGRSPALSAVIGAHYLEALDWRRSMARLATFFGGKSPHPQTFLVGGTSLTPPWGGPIRATIGEHPRRPGSSAPAALSERGLAAIAGLIDVARTFVEGVYLPDVLALADIYRDQAGIGRGIGNYLSYGEFPEDDSEDPVLLLPRGRIMDHDVSVVDAVDQSGVAETVAHAHYTDDGDGSGLRHPLDGRTDPHYAGPAAPITSIAGSTRYSWSKAPRYFDDPMETGPLARVAVAYAAGPEAGDTAATVARIVGDLGLGAEGLLGTLGRTVARAIEAKIVVDRLGGWLRELTANLDAGDLSFIEPSAWDPARWANEVEGWSVGESARGAVGHWVRIRDRRIADYQVVDGSTWNVSPRDGRGRRGALEQALVGTSVDDPGHPIELLRTVRSFDPCIACATH
jgi:Ni,Fe-hydrogenase I large subunit